MSYSDDLRAVVARTERDLRETENVIQTVEGWRTSALKQIEGPSARSMRTAGYADEEWTELAASAHDVIAKLYVTAKNQRALVDQTRESLAEELRREAERAVKAVERGRFEGLLTPDKPTSGSIAWAT